jgi:hypothetical protein
MKVRVRISRLVLDGALVDRSQSRAVAEALRTELSRLLAAAPAESWQARRLRGAVLAPTVQFEPGAGPSRVGRGVARSAATGIAQAVGGGRR